jgi:hypothetical protein
MTISRPELCTAPHCQQCRNYERVGLNAKGRHYGRYTTYFMIATHVVTPQSLISTTTTFENLRGTIAANEMVVLSSLVPAGLQTRNWQEAQYSTCGPRTLYSESDEDTGGKS